MPLVRYGVLKGHVINHRTGTPDATHYHVLVRAASELWRISINVQSRLEPSALLYHIDDALQHPILDSLVDLRPGFTQLPPQPDSAALDYIRGNLFDPSALRPLPHTVTGPDNDGPDNDLNGKLQYYIRRALNQPDALLYAFGEAWGPEKAADGQFGFYPGRGMHEVHMNQGNVARWQADDGVYQDGGLMLYYPPVSAQDEGQWVGIFLAFQSQALHTDDNTGHALSLPSVAPLIPPDAIRIVAALVNPLGDDTGRETITLMNTWDQPVNLQGWALLDQHKRRHTFANITLAAGETLRVSLSGTDVQLSNRGGIISLLNAGGLKVHGVSYSHAQAKRYAGRTLLF